MRNLFLKFLYGIASLNYPKVKKDYRYFIRDNYFSRTRQLLFLLKDYIIKKEYKEIEFQGEFDQELRYVIPFAYWHYLNGTLKKTISCKNTKEFYFFSKHHEERHSKRVWELGYSNFEVPNMTHSTTFSYTKWKQVPFKSFYKNDVFKYDKPILVIANKYNIEWDDAPLNYFSIEFLDWFLDKYQNSYQIIYNRPLTTQIVSDNSDILDLNEHKWLRERYPGVLQMNDLFNENRSLVNNYNHLQLMVYANTENFISAHGGTAALASYFGGVNVILSKRGIEHELKEFDSIFPALSNARIFHALNEDEMRELSQKNFLQC